MIEHTDVQQGAGFDQHLGDADIFGAGSGIAAWVIVDDNDASDVGTVNLLMVFEPLAVNILPFRRVFRIWASNTTSKYWCCKSSLE